MRPRSSRSEAKYTLDPFHIGMMSCAAFPVRFVVAFVVKSCSHTSSACPPRYRFHVRNSRNTRL